ncbi:hypothetical protein DFQ30_005139 [Apophysomyces sp. BC1015]|nr:hypothetical protein DFQ30_005139 [Apophysomyces sp. BC1015]
MDAENVVEKTASTIAETERKHQRVRIKIWDKGIRSVRFGAEKKLRYIISAITSIPGQSDGGDLKNWAKRIALEGYKYLREEAAESFWASLVIRGEIFGTCDWNGQVKDDELRTNAVNDVQEYMPADEQTKYTTGLGMNGILDTSNASPQSQTVSLSVTAKKVQEQFALDLKFKNLANEILMTLLRKQRRHYQQGNDFKNYTVFTAAQELGSLIGSVYAHAFEIHARSQLSFNPVIMSDMTAGDYVVKFWRHISEKLFMGNLYRSKWEVVCKYVFTS